MPSRPCWTAVTCEHLELAKLLLENGARIDVLNQAAVEAASPEMRLLLERAAVVHASRRGGEPDVEPDVEDDVDAQEGDADADADADGADEDDQDDADVSTETGSMVDADDGLGM